MEFAKIRGKSYQDCLMEMKMKYGSEATVISQTVVTEGGVMGTGLLAKKMIEIQIGIPEKQASREKIERKLQDLKDLLKQKSYASPERKKTLQTLKPLSKTLEEKEIAVEEEIEEITTEPDRVGLSFEKELLDKNSFLRRETSTVRKDSPLIRLGEKLVREGMSQSYVEEIISKVEERLSPLDQGRNHAVLERTIEILKERVSVDSDLFRGTGKNQRKVIFFVGPTGSGKTTSVAKLAAKYFLHRGKSVSLYTTDNYRIAAIEQLKRYADTMGMPFYPVKDIKKFKETLARDGSELILIDTAGYSHRNLEQLERMNSLLSCFGEKDSVENLLVLSSTSSYHHTSTVLKAYESLNYRRILLTKLDEADFLGGFLELADTYSKSFTYYSVGQEVPFDILSAEKNLMAECVVTPEKIAELRGEVFTVAGD
ncbi:flagellar biosynthesis protein FlhF [Leptospira interrogans]|uniref:Flagellar biosynthesis protein FlhF n=12 Tax=Leptospira interrogans TaxID=173 RepID=A0A1B9FIB2_LEPIR|nr:MULTISPECIES: flagellar biosynthesis protein FlhF [Leptospira]APH41275.1 Flagellar biosynthesis protein FlhF [Leptospira interrogans serovar Copenhageni/Icterohaemorrhagiae]EMN30760.1 flagellar biosynthesis protein FlhF [Leptospira interrogans serovar Pyrogenes str. L0374]EMN48551.1 flagellar biosynthesis protein FlhF [Leptospira interrogans str. L1207]EMN69773.1 flagellar biosynthesis protein FlhF [Leptospira interrogans serovar Bataviae str. UI 08561]EMO02463.1 flagellar biosynthesis prot